MTMTNQHYFLVAGTLNEDGSVSFVVDDDCDYFQTSRPIWTGDEWVSVDGDADGTDADIRNALMEAFYAYDEMRAKPDTGGEA